MPFISDCTDSPLHGAEQTPVTLQSLMPIFETKIYSSTLETECKAK